MLPGDLEPMSRDPRRIVAYSLLGLIASWHLLNLDRQSLWFDESFSWRLTRFPWAEMIARARRDVHPPLYYVLLKMWTGAFGDSVFAMRLLSFCWFVAALGMVHLFCREATLGPGRPAADVQEAEDSGLFAILFLAADPLIYRYVQEARMYTQELALLFASNWLLLRALREERRRGRWWVAYAVSAAALGYTHYFGLLSVAAQALFVAGSLVVALWPGDRRPSVPARVPWVYWAVGSALLAAALYVPWVPTLRAQQARVAEDYWSRPTSESSPLSMGFWRALLPQMIAYEPNQASASTSAEEPPRVMDEALLAAVCVILLVTAWRRDRVGWLLISGIVAPAAMAITVSYFTGRNSIEARFLLPSFSLLVTAFALVIGTIRPRSLRWAVAGACFLALACLTRNYIQGLGRPAREEARGVAGHIAGSARPGDLVLCTDHARFFPLLYHARGRFPVYQARYPGLVIKHYSGGPIYRDDDFRTWTEALRSGSRRLWILGHDEATRQALELPPGWRLVERLKYPESIRWVGDSVLELWEQDAGARPDDGR